jgi:hypothetical protein
MPRKQYAGGALVTKLNGSINSSTTTVVLVDASTYPSGATAFVIAVDRGLTSEEKMLCVRTVGSNTLTVTTRGFDGTTGIAHNDQATVEHVLDALTIDEANAWANTLTTNGDLLTRSAGNPARLGIGVSGQGLAVASGAPAWQPAYSSWASVAARDAAITAPAAGMIAQTTDTGTLWRYSGTAWQAYFGLICTSATRPTGSDGVTIYETDTDRLMQHNGTGWVIISEPTQTYTPSVTNATLGTGGTVTGTFHRSDGWIDLTILLTFGTSPTVSGNIIFSLPTATVVIQPTTIFELMKGNVIFYDATGNRWYGQTYHDGSNSVGCTYAATQGTPSGNTSITAGGLNASTPFTWAVGDYVLAWVRFQMSNRHSFT